MRDSLTVSCFALIFLCLLIVTAILSNAAECAEWGPPEDYWIIQSCGDGCVQSALITSRRCIRRKP